MLDLINNASGFEWDEGNSDKNWNLHDVTDGEWEQIFFNAPLIVASDTKHSESEIRYFALGRTDVDRWLFVAFTMRSVYIRVISARDMTIKEREKYANYAKKYPRF